MKSQKLKKGILNHPPKPRHNEEPITTKSRISAFSLIGEVHYNNEKKTIEPKIEIPLIAIFIFAFIAFSCMLYIQKIFSTENYKNNRFFNKFKSTKTNSTNSNVTSSYRLFNTEKYKNLTNNRFFNIFKSTKTNSTNSNVTSSYRLFNTEKYKNLTNNRFFDIFNSNKTNSNISKITYSYKLIDDFPLPYMLNSKLMQFIPKGILLFMQNTIIALFYSILVITIAHQNNSKSFFTFIYVTIFFFSDSFMKNSMIFTYNEQADINSTSKNQSLLISIEYLLSIFHLYLCLCFQLQSRSNLNFGYWCFLLCFSSLLTSVLVSFRIEYLCFFIPIIINAIISIRYKFSSIFVFLFIFIIDAIFLILVDRFIGLPSITFDQIQIKHLISILMETDYNGMFLFTMITFIFHMIIFIPISLLKSDFNKNQPPVFNIVFIEEILLICLWLFKVSISSANDIYLTRTYIIRIILFVINGKLLNHYQSNIYSNILLILSMCIAIFYNVFNLNTLSVINLIKN